MRGDGGEIRVAGLADQVVPLTDAERASLRAIPDVEAKLRRSFDLGASEGRAPIAERILAPALNLRGIASGGVGALTTNSIPTHAVASMDFRLVPKQTVDHLKAAVEEHLRRQGFFLVRRDPDAATRRAHPRLVKVEWQPGYPAYRTSIDQPVSRLLEKLLAEASGAKPVMLPSFGGSLPLYLFDEVLHVPVITLPVVNHDNNQHAANEDIRLGHLWDGIEIYAVILARLGELWP
jgi:acetylornithine deacetylase/succinyl-diaminopimelate desuccinylase-like protein